MHILVVRRSTPRQRRQDQPAGVESLRCGSASAAKALFYLSPRCHGLLEILAVEVIVDCCFLIFNFVLCLMFWLLIQLEESNL